VRVEVVMAQPLISSERGEVASVKDMCSEFPLESNCDLMMIMKVNYIFREKHSAPPGNHCSSTGNRTISFCTGRVTVDR